MTRRGRRPGAVEDTKAAILEGARRVFSERGYERATIRSIAEAAGVDPALVHHHFGTKQELFVTAHDLPLSPQAVVEQVIGLDDEGTIGERLARLYLTAAFVEGGSVEALVRAAVSNPTARDMLREFFEGQILARIAEHLGGPDAELRVALAGSHLIGLFMMRRILEIGPIVDAEVDELVRIVAPTLDRYLSGDLVP